MSRSLIRPALVLATAVALAGCASTYQLTLMPRTSGKLYYGEAVEQSAGGEASLSVRIDERVYTGTWVTTSSGRSTGYVTGAVGWGRRGSIGVGAAPVVIDNAEGASAKALLQAADGSGLRCDLRGLGTSGSAGGGTCQDDQGLLYDVQIRLKR